MGESFMNLVLLAASLCVISGARAADLTTNQAYHNVCDSHCAIEDFANVAVKFSRHVTVKKARVVNLTISSRTDSKNDLCQNTSLHDFSNSYLIWAVDEKEPYLYLPPDFLDFSGLFSLQFRQRMNIRLNCTRVVRRAPLDEPNRTSLLDAVIRSLMQDLMQTSGGTLCFPQESQDNTEKSYKCCQFDKSTSEIMCNVAHPTFVRWFQTLRTFWTFVSYIILMYLPAVVCLLPALPKISEGGIRCIELGDQSPAGFRSLIVKACTSQNMASLQEKIRAAVLKVVLVSCIITFPLFFTPVVTIATGYLEYNAVLYGAFVIKSIIDLFLPTPSRRVIKCAQCEICVHSDIGDAMKVHTTAFPSLCLLVTREFSLLYFKWCKSHVYFRLHFKSPVHALRSVCRIFCSIVLFLLAIPVFIVGCALIFFFSLFYFSPSCTICMLYLVFALPTKSDFAPFGNYSRLIRMMYVALLLFTYVSIYSCICVNSVAWGRIVLPYLIMTVVDYGDTAFPILALSFLLLYYLHSCFTSFSEKYQLLKIKLYQGIQQYHMSKGISDEGEDSILVYTKSKATAIPEDLYEAACEELGMPMIETFWVAIMKMACLLIFVVSVFISIMIFGARSGIAPLTKVVAIFLAGFFPKLFSVLSTGESERTLQEFDMERRLKTVITKYAQKETTHQMESSTTLAEP